MEKKENKTKENRESQSPNNLTSRGEPQTRMQEESRGVEEGKTEHTSSGGGGGRLTHEDDYDEAVNPAGENTGREEEGQKDKKTDQEEKPENRNTSDKPDSGEKKENHDSARHQEDYREKGAQQEEPYRGYRYREDSN